jgi:predicted DNA-binding transcriptional regulator YafY
VGGEKEKKNSEFRREKREERREKINSNPQIAQKKLRFSPKVAGNVAEVLWHRTQKLTKHKDGSITFEADVDGLGEISWWVIGYADNVEVLEPKELRKKVGQMAKRTAKIYE